jgi:hypothetical protein
MTSPRAHLSVPFACLVVACNAASIDPLPGASPPGGMGGVGGTEDPGGHGGSPSTCGNGVVDAAEACDGADFAGATCTMFGFAGGELTCSFSCQIIPLGCVHQEACNDGVDNDEDGDADCADASCAGAPACDDGCAAPVLLGLFEMGFSGSFAGHADTTSAGCGASTGPEVVFQLPATPSAGTLTLSLASDDDANLSLRAGCSEPTNREACVFVAGASGIQSLAAPLDANQSLFVVVDAASADAGGSFMLMVSFDD